jgi:hypothetical protein
MALGTRLPTLSRPTAVSVHYDADVLWTGALRTNCGGKGGFFRQTSIISFSFSSRIWLIFPMYESVSF